MKIKRSHWRHFFGGIALLLLIVQFFSGLVLTMYYLPDLKEAYASVQRLYNELGAAAWVRDSHRWTALFIFITVIMHFIRSLLRKDFLNRRSKTFWLTGVLLFLPMLGFLITGFILPWEWRAYWFMEMVPNYVEDIAVIGPALKDFLIDAFTLNRSLMAHVVIFPVITLILMEIHSLSRMRRRKGGLSMYIVEHGLFTFPFLIAIGVLAYALAMPTQDPEIVPLPLEGAYIPAPEWFALIFYVPYMHFKGFTIPLLNFYIPLIIFIVLVALPYVIKRKKDRVSRTKDANDPSIMKVSMFDKLAAKVRHIPGVRSLARSAAYLSVFLVAMGLFGALYAGTAVSPTMGCNSCHNIASGMRMGVPPVTFKNRARNPLLENKQWMVEHWFYPQVVW